jgi:hypothetical protein
MRARERLILKFLSSSSQQSLEIQRELEFLQATHTVLIVSVNFVTRRTSGHSAFLFRLYLANADFIYPIWKDAKNITTSLLHSMCANKIGK